MTSPASDRAQAVAFAARWSPAEVDVPPPAENRLRIVPLGGLGEVGKNMMVFHYGDDVVIVDCGVQFPPAWMPGVDVVLPNFSYVLQHRNQVRAVLLTHGHEDHIGAIPYLWPHLPDVPWVGTRLTLGLVRSKVKEFGLAERLILKEVEPRDRVRLGAFEAEFVHVVHSISGSVGIALRTPVGLVFHTGDFKFDSHAPPESDTDAAHLRRLGDEGVSLLLSDSTYAERPGRSTSERVVGETFLELFRHCPGRIIVTTFASSIPRLQHVVDAGLAHDRMFCFHGRSLEENLQVATALGYLNVPSDRLVSIEQLESVAENRLVVIATGSQGEPLSALSLMATRRHPRIQLHEGDTVIFSATPIPGHERQVSDLVNLLYRNGVEIILDTRFKSEAGTGTSPRVHASGHASRDELKLMMDLVRPQQFVPLHGEYRMLLHHARLAQAQGIPATILEDGQVFELYRTASRDLATEVIGTVPCGDVLVDGASMDSVDAPLLRERVRLGQQGVCVVGVAIDRRRGSVLSGPELVTRGFLRGDLPAVLDAAKAVAVTVLSESSLAARACRPSLASSDDAETEMETIRSTMKGALSRFFVDRVGHRPIIVPVILEV